jgi:branched-subunit amino acid transport protein
MKDSSYIYLFIAVMALATYACRVFAFTVIRRPIENRFFRSFLYYVPYVTLAVMTFPAIMDATRSPYAGLLALIVGIGLAWKGLSLFKVAAACCMVVFGVELLIL